MSFSDRANYLAHVRDGRMPKGGPADQTEIDDLRCVDLAALSECERVSTVKKALVLLSEHPLDGQVHQAVRRVCGDNAASIGRAVFFDAATCANSLAKGLVPSPLQSEAFSSVLRSAAGVKPAGD